VRDLDEYGTEFYLGDADAIGAACAKRQWRRLRRGEGADAFVGFSRGVHSLDTHLLSKAVALTMGRPEVSVGEYERRVAGEEGLWGADVLPRAWVEELARTREHVAALHRHWWRVHEETYEPNPPFGSPAVRAALQGLADLCHRAVERSRDLVEVWTLV
jgi:hypothetical protein